jgi:hypothetical protein
VTRERLVRAAARAWPAATRAEIADTALETGASGLRLARELAALVWRGLASRAISSGNLAAALLDAVSLAGGLIAVLSLAGHVHVAGRVGDAPRFYGELALLSVTAALSIAGRDRRAGAGLLASIAWAAASGPRVGTSWVNVALPIPCAVAMLGSGRRPLRRELLLSTAVVLPLALLARPAPLEEGVAILALASIPRIATDPRPAIACSLVAIWIACIELGYRTDTKVSAIVVGLAGATLLAAVARARAASATRPARRR